MGILSIPLQEISRIIVLKTSADLDSGLAVFYPFSGDANDKSGHGYKGTVHGPELCNDRFGNANSAYSFDGNDTYISIPDGIVRYNIPAFSMSAWLLFPDLNNTRTAVYIGATTGEANLQIRDSRITFSVDLARKWYDVSAEGIPNTWVHIVGVYRRGKSIEIWINGEYKSETPIPATDLFRINQSHHSTIGSYAPAYFEHAHSSGIGSWLGAIDQVRVYDRALKPEEIRALFASDM